MEILETSSTLSIYQVVGYVERTYLLDYYILWIDSFMTATPKVLFKYRVTKGEQQIL